MAHWNRIKRFGFEIGGAGKFKSEKSPSKKNDLRPRMIKALFRCFAVELDCVQRPFLVQLVETAD